MITTDQSDTYLDVLADHRWETPPDYGAFEPDANPVGDYVIYSRHRDSEILIESNYDALLFGLQYIAKMHGCKEKVYDFRAGHWASGWVETIIVRADAHPAVLQQAAEYLEALSDYPVVDEDDYSDRQSDAVYKYWDELSLEERVDWCKDCGDSVFAARGERSIPDGVMSELIQHEMFF